MKRFVTLATAGALVLGAAVPTFAATATDTVKVKWNVTAVGTLKAYANYSGTVAAPASTNTAGSVNSAMAAVADTSSRCSGGVAPGTASPYLVDFGNVTPDLVNPTACIYNNAVAVVVQTNSTSWSLAETMTAPTGGFTVCGVPNIGTAWPETPLTTGTITTSTKTAGTALVNTGVSACPAGETLGTTAVNMANLGANGTGATAFAEDLGLVMPAAAAGSQTQTITFTLTYS